MSIQSSQIVLDVKGMTCAGCAARVTRALDAVPSIEHTEVNLALDRATIFVNDNGGEAQAIAALEEAGFTATLFDDRTDGEGDDQSATQRDFWSLIAGAVLTTPLVMMMVLPFFGIPFHMPAWLQMLLATPVQFILGYRFYHGAYVSLRNGAGNMDVLVALGTSAAFLLSTWIMFRDGAGTMAHLYFEASAVIITLVLAGKFLEARAKRATTKAIRQLMDLRPDTARVVRGEDIVEIDADQVREGDIVLVRPGERIPVDGEIVRGKTEVDESLITGEALPIVRVVGDLVTGGSINGMAAIDVRTTRVGRDTTLSRIIRLVESAQSGKAPVQRLVDRISAIFVPIVVAISAVTFVGWLFAGGSMEMAIINAVSVLVIACPCALGLATPTALVAGMGAAARAGILIRDIEVLERAYKITQVLFDKTGTLTTGAPTVVDVAVFDDDKAKLLALAAAVQEHSEHPLARAIVEYARAAEGMRFHASDVVAKVGRGVSGTVDGRKIIIGNAAMMADAGVDIGVAASKVSENETAGSTSVLVAEDGQLIGLFGIRDRLRDEAAASVRLLRSRGVETGMLSGDTQKTAASIAADLDLGTVQAEVKPDQKAAEIERRKAQGHVIAMVGDGLNDAPALAAADVGIAMGSGTDVAMETAGITLMRPDPRLVAAALDVARATWQRIRWNLFWAFAFNVIGLPLAAFGYLSPEVAGAAMAMSSVAVVTSSLLLRQWRPRGLEG